MSWRKEDLLFDVLQKDHSDDERTTSKYFFHSLFLQLLSTTRLRFRAGFQEDLTRFVENGSCKQSAK
jgi:hypothetical protein